MFGTRTSVTGAPAATWSAAVLRNNRLSARTPSSSELCTALHEQHRADRERDREHERREERDAHANRSARAVHADALATLHHPVAGAAARSGACACRTAGRSCGAARRRRPRRRWGRRSKSRPQISSRISAFGDNFGARRIEYLEQRELATGELDLGVGPVARSRRRDRARDRRLAGHSGAARVPRRASARRRATSTTNENGFDRKSSAPVSSASASSYSPSLAVSIRIGVQISSSRSVRQTRSRSCPAGACRARSRRSRPRGRATGRRVRRAATSTSKPSALSPRAIAFGESHLVLDHQHPHARIVAPADQAVRARNLKTSSGRLSVTTAPAPSSCAHQSTNKESTMRTPDGLDGARRRAVLVLVGAVERLRRPAAAATAWRRSATPTTATTKASRQSSTATKDPQEAFLALRRVHARARRRHARPRGERGGRRRLHRGRPGRRRRRARSRRRVQEAERGVPEASRRSRARWRRRRPERCRPEQAKKQALAFAKCMREHGIDMPDPEFEGGGTVRSIAPGDGLDPNDPQMQAAMKECQKGAGLRGPGSGHRDAARRWRDARTTSWRRWPPSPALVTAAAARGRPAVRWPHPRPTTCAATTAGGAARPRRARERRRHPRVRRPRRRRQPALGHDHRLPAAGATVERGQSLSRSTRAGSAAVRRRPAVPRPRAGRERRRRRAPARGEPRRARVRRRASTSTRTSTGRRPPRSVLAGVARRRGDRHGRARRTS